MDLRGVWLSVPLEQYPDGNHILVCEDGVVSYPGFTYGEEKVFSFAGLAKELPRRDWEREAILLTRTGFHLVNQYVIGTAHDDERFALWLELEGERRRMNRLFKGEVFTKEVLEALAAYLSMEGWRNDSAEEKRLIEAAKSQASYYPKML